MATNLGSDDIDIRIGTGSEGGTYYPLGRGLARVIDRALGDRGTAEAIVTTGSTENLLLLGRGEVELAIIQNDTDVDANIRTVAPLYLEILQIVVRRDRGIRAVNDLVGHPMAVGLEDSGTANLVGRVLTHFQVGIDVADRLHMSTSAAVDGFLAGNIDVVFVLSGLPSAAVERMLTSELGELLSLGSPSQVGSALEGLRIAHPFLTRSVIPVRTYGNHPTDPVGTVAVQAVLVTRDDLPVDVVHDLTRAIFENRVDLIQAHRAAAHLTEQFDPHALQAFLHEGADAFYRRDAPPFYIEYAEMLSFFLTLMLAVGSGTLAIRNYIKRKKKDRIDVYYLDIQGIVSELEANTVSLEDATERLGALRTRAFQELVQERLAADQSFTIFQDYLTSQIKEVLARPA